MLDQLWNFVLDYPMTADVILTAGLAMIAATWSVGCICLINRRPAPQSDHRTILELSNRLEQRARHVEVLNAQIHNAKRRDAELRGQIRSPTTGIEALTFDSKKSRSSSELVAAPNQLTEYAPRVGKAALENLASFYVEGRDYIRAAEMMHKAVQLNIALGNKEGTLAAYINLANIQGMLGDFDGAKRAYRDALELSAVS